MLSKIIIILLSILLMVLSLSFFGSMEAIDIQTLFVPKFSSIDFSSPALLILLGMTLILMILGLLFSSIESSNKVTRLLNFLKNGMQEKDFQKLDKVSKNIAEYIKELADTDTTSQPQNESLSSLESSEVPSEESKVEEPQKEETQNMEQEETSKPEQPKEEPMEEFTPAMPNPDEFDGEDKKTIVASSFSLEGLKSLKTENEEQEEMQPSKFSDFADDEDSSKGAETVISTVPEELLKESQNLIDNSREEDLKKVFNKFYEMKVELGESTNSLTEAAFLKKLKDTEAKLIESNKCKRVEFMVYNKNGKAALKATPKY